MKVLALMGSPRPQGNTATLLNEYLRGLRESDENFELRTVNLHKSNIKYCNGCHACKTEKYTRCVTQDDMQDLYHDIEESDVMIIASPIFTFDVTAQTKVFLDRVYGSDLKNFNPKKKLVFLTTYGDFKYETSGAVNAATILRTFTGYTQMEYAQELAISTSKNEYYDYPVSENKEAREKAYKMGKSLMAS